MLLIIRVSHCGEKNRWDAFRKQDFKGARQIIICGVEHQKENYILEDDVLYLKCRDKWEDLPEKMIAAYSAILDIPEFNDYTRFLKVDADIEPLGNFSPEYICKTGDNANYFGGNLRKPAIHQHGVYHLKKNLSDRSPWKGRKYSNAEFLKVTFALGGIGYVLTRHAMTKVTMKHNFNNLNKVKHEFIYEDGMVGVLLKRHGMNPKKVNLGLRDTRKSQRKSSGARRRRISNRSMSLVRAGLTSNKYPRRRRHRNGPVSR